MVSYYETVELMSMNRDIPSAGRFPGIFPVHRDAYQMRHHVPQSAIVVPFYPDHLHISFWIGEFPYVREKLPVLSFQAPEIQIAEDVTQKNQPAESDRSKEIQCLACSRDFASQMEIGENQEIIDRFLHADIVANDCYIQIKSL
jgi:hypothetical protein